MTSSWPAIYPYASNQTQTKDRPAQPTRAVVIRDVVGGNLVFLGMSTRQKGSLPRSSTYCGVLSLSFSTHGLCFKLHIERSPGTLTKQS